MLANLLFKTRIPEKIPKSMQTTVNKLKKSKNKEDCLKKAYLIITKKYRGYRVRTYTHLWELFAYDLKDLWHRNGFLHCTNLNYLLRVLLIKSGFFKDSDVEPKWTLLYFFSPHQYLKVKVKNKTINIGLWGKAFGIKYGDYAHGMHMQRESKQKNHNNKKNFAGK
jgi:hypothetical protein